MLPDVIDEATLKSEVRREELFYAFFVFGNKFGSGVTLGISTAIYKLVRVQCSYRNESYFQGYFCV